MLTVGSLFSGIGGMDLGLERAGMRVEWQVEIDDYARRVLTKHWPHVPKYGDITTIDWATVPRVDVLCGGFPCQDLSYAGKRAGLREGTRSGLWFHYLRAIRALRPRYILVENVPGLLTNHALGRVLGDLAESGYDAEWDCLPASAVGAPHRRDRVWLVAYPQGERTERTARTICQTNGGQGAALSREFEQSSDVADTFLQQRHRWSDGVGWWEREPQETLQALGGRRRQEDGLSIPESLLGRVAHGIPSRLDGFDLNSVIEEIEKYAIRTLSDPREVLRILWEENGSPTFQKRGTRIPDHVSKEKILQLVLCKLQSFASEEYVSQESAETPQGSVRSVWIREAFTGAPCRSGLYEQRPKEYPDSLQALSRLLAQVSHSTWLRYRRSYATDRVNRLKGLGNAVVPQIVEVLGKMILAGERETGGA